MVYENYGASLSFLVIIWYSYDSYDSYGTPQITSIGVYESRVDISLALHLLLQMGMYCPTQRQDDTNAGYLLQKPTINPTICGLPRFWVPDISLQIWTLIVDHIISYHTIFHISHLIYHIYIYIICHKTDIIYHIYIYMYHIIYIYILYDVYSSCCCCS